MSGSLLTLPLRLGVRAARVSLHAGRDLADLGLATLEVIERVIEEPEVPEPPFEEPGPRRPRTGPRPLTRIPVRPATAPPDEPTAAPSDEAVATPPDEPAAAPLDEPAAARPDAVAEAPAPEPEGQPPVDGIVAADAHLPEDRTLVEEVADPGAEQGAGASLRVAPPFAGYDQLRAADVIARLAGVDTAELAATELYERSHRGRRTVLEAVAREMRRRPPA